MASVSARRTERLLNLVIALASTRRALTKEQVRSAVPQYEECLSTEAFDRMFERDKEELRELGVPLVTVATSAWFEDELGYRIDRDAYALPEVSFTPGELAMLSLASRVWARASLAGPAARALVKLRALGVEPDEDALIGLEPRVRTAEPAFGPLYAAARDRAAVAFRYRAASTGTLSRRSVQPWQVTSWRGRWYLVGHDTDRADTRVFRLSRIVGKITRTGPVGGYAVPADVDGRALISRLADRAEVAVRVAHLRLAPGRAQQLRLRAVDPGPDAGHDPGLVPADPAHPVDVPRDVARDVAPEVDEVFVPFTDPEELAAVVAAAGTDALVLAPDDLRAAVRRQLRAVLTAHTPRRARARRRPRAAAAPR